MHQDTAQLNDALAEWGKRKGDSDEKLEIYQLRKKVSILATQAEDMLQENQIKDEFMIGLRSAYDSIVHQTTDERKKIMNEMFTDEVTSLSAIGEIQEKLTRNSQDDDLRLILQLTENKCREVNIHNLKAQRIQSELDNAQKSNDEQLKVFQKEKQELLQRQQELMAEVNVLRQGVDLEAGIEGRKLSEEEVNTIVSMSRGYPRELLST